MPEDVHMAKSISITNYKIHLKKVFQVLGTSGPKYKIILTKVLEL